MKQQIEERLTRVGLDERQQFLFAPNGFPITPTEKMEIESIGVAVAEFLHQVDDWYHHLLMKKGGSWWLGVLNSGIPRPYVDFPWQEGLPVTTMVDLVCTREGWRVVEIDVTNRNGLGFPALWRHLYKLPALWGENHRHWQDQGWAGVTQILGSRQRFYEPYFRYFLSHLGGSLVGEENLPEWLATRSGKETLLDLPILYSSRGVVSALLLAGAGHRIGIVPKHYLSSKAVLSLPFEEDVFRGHGIEKFLPYTRLLCRSRPLPEGSFFVKALQSGGAKGTFENDAEKLAEFGKFSKAGAIWQDALPIIRRPLSYLEAEGSPSTRDFYTRFTIFVTPEGRIIDADVTASTSTIVHGGVNSAFTVPIVR